ncbi:MAG TPA: phenylalanine--tRNA ligase beta subunit-related protein [Polyangiales bacterium]|nr:phenylalanine--tRNA ligase beta subunit-related protein [Polyangiales bacterium]
MEFSIAPHPLLDARVFTTSFERELASYAAASPLHKPPDAPFDPPDDSLRASIRDLLRHSGFKPTGRSKPASEYLLRAQAEGGLRPINFAVDVCNLVSLYSGLPISVVDLDRLAMPVSIAPADEAASYVFNPAGQTIDVGRLLCLHDANGPCANAVKDAQRTKTSDETRNTLSVIWSSQALRERTDAALVFYFELLTMTEGVEVDMLRPDNA